MQDTIDTQKGTIATMQEIIDILEESRRRKDGSNNNFRTANALHSFCFSSISNKNSSRPFV